MSHTKFASCPKCGTRCTAVEGHGLMHGAGHSLLHGVRHSSPLFVGMGLLAAAVQAVKNHWFRCEKCGQGFFAR